MRMVRFGKTGVMVPAVSLGTWGHGGPGVAGGASVGWSGNDDRLARRALISAYQLGITHWDTADVYGAGHAEELIGSIWNDVPRDAIFLATKTGYDNGPYDHPYHPRQIRHQMERSLRLMRASSVDLYYFHHCNFGAGGEFLDDALSTMRDLRSEGKTRFIGLSDWDSSRIARHADRVRPDAVQPYRNVIDDTYESSGLRKWVEENDAGVAFFAPLMHGLLLGKYDIPVEFPEGDFRRNVAGFRDPRFVARMKSARISMEQTWPDSPEPVIHALVGALLADAPTACVLLGQRNEQQVLSASRAGDALDPGEAARVRSIYRGEGG